jgi:Zn-dependent alcohol dehydrogenase
MSRRAGSRRVGAQLQNSTSFNEHFGIAQFSKTTFSSESTFVPVEGLADLQPSCLISVDIQ